MIPCHNYIIHNQVIESKKNFAAGQKHSVSTKPFHFFGEKGKGKLLSLKLNLYKMWKF